MHLLVRPRGNGGHPNGVGGMAIHPERKIVATYAFGLNADVSAGWQGKTDNTVRLWDAPSQSPFAVLTVDAPAAAAAFAGSNRLITGTINGGIQFWNVADVRNGALAVEHELKAKAVDSYSDAVVGIAASAEDGFAVTASASGMVCGWNTATGAQRWCVSHGNGMGVIRVAVSPDGKQVASGDELGTVELRDAQQGQLLHTLKHVSGGSINAIVFSPGSGQLASGDEKGELRLWDTAEGKALDAVAHREGIAVAHREGITDIAYSLATARQYIATVSKDASLRIIDQSPFFTTRIEEFRTDYALWRLALDPDGLFVAVARGDGYVDIWGRRESRVVGRIHILSGDVATGVAFLANNLVAVVDGGGGVQFFEATAGRDAWIGGDQDRLDHLAVASSGVLAAADFAGEGALWALTDGAPKRLPVQAPPLGALDFAPDGSQLASVDDDAGRLRILTMPDGKEATGWPVPDNVGAVAWHPFQDQIAVGKRDGGIWIHDAKTGRELLRPPPVDAPLGAIRLSFASDVGWLAIVDPDRGLYVWDVSFERRAAPIALADGHDVRWAIFLRSSHTLATAEKSGRVRLWRTPASRPVLAALGPTWAVDSCEAIADLAASDDGLAVAAGCEDGRIFVWRAASGAVVSNMTYPAKLSALAFAPGGHTLIAAGTAGVQGFLVGARDLVNETCRRLPRNLSQAEWTRDVGRNRCQRTCPALPGCD
jgi:WD40 repeat protein